ncbi:glycerate kinase [Brachybacterium sp. EF45031]|uniref:glycerate kinase n=1 Tax=Brachybacterium sillae TaxID=2810536 RepID=UPI00217DEAF5|nr:glycerate kinase [Brachybacterium sillae]MCS6710985.1 glycerate kinase [Brachybacterium sillae]
MSVLTLGLIVVILMVVALGAAVSSVQLDRHELQDAADGAALAASQGIDESGLYEPDRDRTGIPLSEGEMRRAARSYLDAYPFESPRLRDVTLVDVTRQPGGEVTIRLAARTDPALIGWLTRGADRPVPSRPPAPAGPGESFGPAPLRHDGVMSDVLVAPDKFKGTLTAVQVAEALTCGLHRARPELSVRSLPIADGGDGTVDAFCAAGWTPQQVTVSGPLGDPVTARLARRGDRAVVELAMTSGITLLPAGELHGERAGTRGLGEAILAARHLGARRLLIGVGGSASTDGGAGMLQALGARLLDADGRDIGPGARGLADLDRVDLEPARRALDGLELQVACDVTNPLLGSEGAAAVFGPQKGLTGPALEAADRALARFAYLLDPTGALAARPGAGAAGGTGFALQALGAEHVPGADAVLTVLAADAALDDSRAVVIGEGRLDEQTLQGKGPGEVARRARARGLTVLAVAGAVALDEDTLRRAGIDRTWDLTALGGSVEAAMTRGADLLTLAGEQMARALA